MIRLEIKGGQETEQFIQPGGDLEDPRYLLAVRLQVSGVELFERIDYTRTVFSCQVEEEEIGLTLEIEPGNPWVHTSAAALAVKGLRLAEDACEGKAGMLYLSSGDTLQLRPAGEEVEVYSSLSGRSARAGCAELVQAFAMFATKVGAWQGLAKGGGVGYNACAIGRKNRGVAQPG